MIKTSILIGVYFITSLLPLTNIDFLITEDTQLGIKMDEYEVRMNKEIANIKIQNEETAMRICEHAAFYAENQDFYKAYEILNSIDDKSLYSSKCLLFMFGMARIGAKVDVEDYYQKNIHLFEPLQNSPKLLLERQKYDYDDDKVIAYIIVLSKEIRQ